MPPQEKRQAYDHYGIRQHSRASTRSITFDHTYGHLAPHADDQERELLDAFAAAEGGD